MSISRSFAKAQDTALAKAQNTALAKAQNTALAKAQNTALAKAQDTALAKAQGKFRLLCLVMLLGLMLACNGPISLGSEPTATPTRIAATATPAGPPTPTLVPAYQPPPPTATLAPNGGARTLADPYAPDLGNGGYFVQSYYIRLFLNPLVEKVAGFTEIVAISNMEGLSQLSLDFVGFDLISVQIDGEQAEFYREDRKLIVTPPQPLDVGTTFRILVTYDGQPRREKSAYLPLFRYIGLTYPGTNTIFVFGEPDGARYWFPANDHPRDKATFRFEITVPAGYTAVANGILEASRPEQMPDGRQGETFIWAHDFPMATYLAQVAVGEYVRLEGETPGGIPLRHYVFPDLVSQVEALSPTAADALDWMAAQFGPYPFEAFGFVTADVRRLSLETQTMVLLSDQMLTERILVHEIAHMWFGNWVSLDSWADMWRNEGFATYIAALYLSRHDPALLEADLETIRETAEEKKSGSPLNQLAPDLLFSSDSYNGGALLVHDLRLAMGDEAFYTGLQLYFQRYGGGTASQAEFQAVLEEAAGRELGSVFERWLE